MPDPTPKTQAAVFVTHLFDEEMQERYLHLKNTAGPGVQTFVMADRGTLVPKEYEAETLFFDYQELVRLFLESDQLNGEYAVKGAFHLVVCEFWKQHPHFSFYWFIEYDVVFTGPWSLLFESCSELPADLWTCHLHERAKEPKWYWWPCFAPNADLLPENTVRSLVTLARFSPKALALLDTVTQQNWRGHHEALIPSALLHHGLTVRDFGGRGRFVPEGWENRFYTSPRPSLRGLLSLFGTMICQPSHLFTWKKNTLYHPLKPRAFWRSNFKLWTLALKDVLLLLRDGFYQRFSP